MAWAPGMTVRRMLVVGSVLACGIAAAATFDVGIELRRDTACSNGSMLDATNAVIRVVCGATDFVTIEPGVAVPRSGGDGRTLRYVLAGNGAACSSGCAGEGEPDRVFATEAHIGLQARALDGVFEMWVSY